MGFGFSVRRLACASLCILMSAPDATAGILSRAEVEMAINDVASRWGVDADNHHLRIMRMATPRSSGEIGFACGEILPLGSPTRGSDFRSFQATLAQQDGEVAVIGIVAFYQSVEELLQDELCDR